MEKFFEVNGCVFETEFAFPPLNKEKIQNAIMIAPYKEKMYIFIWNCWNYTGDEDTDVWGWEPFCPLNQDDGMALPHLIQKVRENLGI